MSVTMRVGRSIVNQKATNVREYFDVIGQGELPILWFFVEGMRLVHSVLFSRLQSNHKRVSVVVS